MLGRAPVADFDGTLARLAVAWLDLRTALGVARIDDLWERHDAAAWDLVRAAEATAAASADPVQHVLEALDESNAFAVLTSNSEEAVWTFLDRFPSLRARAVLVIGRETLAGPKTAYPVFARGFEACVSATESARGDDQVVYVGDQEYELEFARRLGAAAYNVEVIDEGGV